MHSTGSSRSARREKPAPHKPESKRRACGISDAQRPETPGNRLAAPAHMLAAARATRLHSDIRIRKSTQPSRSPQRPPLPQISAPHRQAAAPTFPPPAASQSLRTAPPYKSSTRHPARAAEQSAYHASGLSIRRPQTAPLQIPRTHKRAAASSQTRSSPRPPASPAARANPAAPAAPNILQTQTPARNRSSRP